MKAVVIESIGNVVLKEVDYPQIDDDGVVIKVKASGLCGSDYHILHGTYPAKYPLIPGHEFSGVIDKIGKNVNNWKIGDRVVADPNIYCGKCYYCMHDQENMCENADAIGVTLNGAFAEYVAVPAKQLYVLPDTMTFEDGALVEPVSCVVYAMLRLKVRYGDRAVVFGVGPMGLLLLQALKTGGASEVVCMDISKDRLQAAKKLGAKIFDNIDEIKKLYPRGFDIVVDATGNTDVISKMFQVAGKRAKILQFGCSDSNKTIEISPFELYDNDWQYIGTRALLFTFNQAIDLINNNAISSESVINDLVGIEKIPEYLLGNRPKESLKVIMKL